MLGVVRCHCPCGWVGAGVVMAAERAVGRVVARQEVVEGRS